MTNNYLSIHIYDYDIIQPRVFIPIKLEVILKYSTREETQFKFSAKHFHPIKLMHLCMYFCIIRYYEY